MKNKIIKILRKFAEKELKDERNLLRTLIDKIPFPIYVMDINGRKVIANKADVENICCSTESEVIGKTDLELFPGEIGIRGYADSMSVIKTGKPLIDLEEKFINNGIQRWLLTSQYPLHNTNGQIKGLVGIGYEITERKKAEDDMRHSHYLMSYIIEHSNSAIAVHDKDLKYIYVSKSYLKEYNVTEQNIIGKHHYEVFPDIPQKWKDVHQKALQGVVSSADEDLFIREDGSEWWTRWECRPWYDSEGLIGGIIIYTEVITERKNMERKIIESEAYYRALIDLSPDGIIIADYEGTISYVSKKALDILNVPAGISITGSSVLNFFASDSVESIISRVSDILIGNLLPETREYKLKKYNGPMFWENCRHLFSAIQMVILPL
jgi:PAS domain S-box-containing protein